MSDQTTHIDSRTDTDQHDAGRRPALAGTRPGSGSTGASSGRVSTLELFFDLVFVFTITQLTAVLAGDPMSPMSMNSAFCIRRSGVEECHQIRALTLMQSSVYGLIIPLT